MPSIYQPSGYKPRAKRIDTVQGYWPGDDTTGVFDITVEESVPVDVDTGLVYPDGEPIIKTLVPYPIGFGHRY